MKKMILALSLIMASLSGQVDALTFTKKPTSNSLGSNFVTGVYVIGGTVYASTTGGLSISTDGGLSFTNYTHSLIDDGLGGNNVQGVYVSDNTVYAATAPNSGGNGGVSISTDIGAIPAFTNHITGLGDNFVQGVYAIKGTVYAATNGGLSISTDGGATFTNRTTVNGLGNNIVFGVYADGSTVYAATFDGLSISTDGGATFTNRTKEDDGLGSNFVFGVHVTGARLYAATAGGLSISTDGGVSFTNRTTADGLGTNASKVVYGVYVIGGTVYAATYGGVSVSTDGGVTFTNYSLGDVNPVNGVFAVGGTIYAATQGGLFIAETQHIAVNAGNNQSATVGSTLMTPPSVIVLDTTSANPVPVVGAEVTFEVATGGGSITGGTATTDASGIATVGSWTLGSTAGANTLTASSSGVTDSPLTFTATGTPGAATRLAFVSEPANAVIAASTGTITVEILDANGNPVTNDTSPVTLSIANNAGSGSLSGTATINAVSGLATFSGLSINKVGAGYTLSATSDGLPPVAVLFDNLAAGSPSGSFGVSNTQWPAQEFSTTATEHLFSTVSLRLWNQNGTSGNFEIQIWDASGTSGSPGAQVGSAIYTGRAEDLGSSGGSLLTVSGLSVALQANTTYYLLVRGTQLTDVDFGGGFFSYPGALYWDVTSVNTSNAYVSTDNGSSWGNPYAQNLYMSVKLLESAISTAFDITAGAISVGSAGTMISGTPLSVTADGIEGATFSVQLKDASGNNISQAGVTVQFSTGIGTFYVGETISSIATTNANGVASAVLKSTFAGTTNITATVDHDNNAGTNPLSITNGSPVSVTFNAGAVSATNSTVVASPATDVVADGVATSTITVTLKDANNNPVPGKTVGLAATNNGASSTISSPSGSSSASGVVTFTVGNTIAETVTYTATGDDVVITGTATVAFIPGAATQIAVNAGNNQSATVGTALATAPSVIVRDANNNPVAGVAVTFAVASGEGNVTDAVATTDASGIASVGSWTLGTTAGANTLTATSGLLFGSPLTFTAIGSAGTATAAAITTQPSASTASGVAFAQQPVIRTVDANGNTVTSSGVDVVASIASGTGAISGTTTVAAIGGIATFTDLVITGTAGDFRLTFTPTDLTAVTSDALTITEGAASSLAFVAQPSNAVIGASTGSIAVEILDANGNRVTDNSSSVTLSIANNVGSAALSGTVTVNAVSGLATFSGLSINNVGTGYTLSAAASELTSTTSSAFDISQKALTIADPALTKTKAYDGTTSAAVTVGALSGVETGDEVTVSAVASYDNANVATAKTITVSYTLTGDDAANHIAPADFVVNDGVIEAAVLTVTADADQSKLFGATDLTLTYALSAEVPVTGALARAEGENVGGYAITIGTLSAGDNYTTDFKGGDFEITAIDFANSTFSIDTIADQTHSGSAITPNVVVRDGTVMLTLDTDYTVTYTNNTDVGTVRVTVTGRGNYSGTLEEEFLIVPAPLPVPVNRGLGLLVLMALLWQLSMRHLSRPATKANSHRLRR